MEAGEFVQSGRASQWAAPRLSRLVGTRKVGRRVMKADEVNNVLWVFPVSAGAFELRIWVVELSVVPGKVAVAAPCTSEGAYPGFATDTCFVGLSVPAIHEDACSFSSRLANSLAMGIKDHWCCKASSMKGQLPRLSANSFHDHSLAQEASFACATFGAATSGT
ncbi:uncharacterized protein B0I36DRAFT_356356 [Microdochium trichocladiopsis]|uniref:Uncharacterized protein n=1 Tax=Microdochium trichocladiopsis TaxID=1682393 RepID=A0A9P9BFL8_9PEZI|nr:uncharacterized protein B0I36DRAFT_356356 [Microdochium trichocladiopsis]KAH7012285.1 hypothetical protein B0I36DRAFT_356356 [Microdochium trichocladiopsis]